MPTSSVSPIHLTRLGRLVAKGDRAYQAPRFISALSRRRAILARSRPSTKGPEKDGGLFSRI